MPLETQVFVDGEWITHIMDFHTVLDKNRESLRPHPKLPQPKEVPPVVGILSRTIVRSPVVKWIIPARIRSENKNDVLFIGECFVQIRELHLDGHLQNIAVKDNFGSAIRHAQVFGIRRKPEHRGLDAIIKKEYPESMAAAANGSEFWTHKRADKSPKSPKLPPQILALTLDSSELVLLFAYHMSGPNGPVEFLSSQRPLPRGRGFLEKLGQTISVDPKSRALAIAACENCFMICALKSMAELREEMEVVGEPGAKTPLFEPIKEERYLSVDGIILKMEFLYPAPGDESHIILLLVISKDHKTRLLVYEWDHTSPNSLQSVKRHGNHGLRVGDRDKAPLLLIPLTISSAFLLVSELSISVYTLEDVLEGKPKPRFGGGFPTDPKDPVTGRLPTAWARPERREAYASKHDDIFISLEDGLVLFLEINSDDPVHLHTSMCAGPLGCHIDTAFASLDLGIDRDDLLIAGGDMSVGGLYLVRPRQDPEFVESVPNWTPITDFLTANVSIEGDYYPKRPRRFLLPRERIFACTGRGSHGCLSEIQFGMEARIGTYSEYLMGVNQIWTLPDTGNLGTYIFFSFPLRSSLLHMSWDSSDIQEIDEGISKMDMERRTLAAGAFEDNIIQVTERSIIITKQHPSLDGPATVCFTSSIDPQEARVVEAAIHTSSCCIITAVQRRDEVRLHAARMISGSGVLAVNEIGEGIVLPSVPSCLSIFTIHGDPYIFVGNRDQSNTLQIFKLDLHLGIKHVLDHDFNPTSEQGNIISPEELVVCHSFAVLEDGSRVSRAGSPGLILLCGFRDGLLAILGLQLDLAMDDIQVHMEIRAKEEFRMGDTAVVITPDTASPSSAFIICGSNLCRFDYNGSRCTPSALSNIWFTDRHEPCYKQSPIAAITRVHNVEDSVLDGSLVCLSGTRLIIAKLDETEGTVTRHISLGDSPKRVWYSNFLKVLIVAVSGTSPTPSLGSPHSPSSPGFSQSTEEPDDVLSCLRFVDPNSGQIITHKPVQRNAPIGAWERRAKGRILGIMDWEVLFRNHAPLQEKNRRDGSGHENGATSSAYHFILIYTGSSISETIPREIGPPKIVRKESGNIVLLSIKRNDVGELECRQRYIINRDMPVYSVAPYDECSLVYSSGTKVCYQRLRYEERSFAHPVEYNLRSNVLHVSVEGDFIYATTASDSLVILKCNGKQMTPCFSDEIARSGLYHLALPSINVALVTDKEGTLTGLWHPSERRNEAGLSAIFEIDVPGSISRLKFASVRPPWRPRAPCRGIYSFDEVSGRQRDIIGTALDGSVLHFTLLHPPAWRLLRFLQNLCMRNWKICPFDRVTLKSHVEPQQSLRFMQVDGDVLYRLFELGGVELDTMLKKEPMPDSYGQNFTDYHSASDRIRRFTELVKDLYETKGKGKGREGEEDSVAIAMDYLKILLQPIF